jgi:hypothetical protein
MSTLNVPVKDIGLYPDSVNPVHRQPTGTSVSNFAMLMNAPLGPVAEIAGLPGKQTTESDALTEMLEFTRRSMENQFVSSGSAQGTASTASASASTSTPSRNIDIATSANDGALKSASVSADSGASSSSSDAASSPAAANAAAQKVQQLAVVVPEKKPAPTFFQSLRRQFSKT